MPDPPGGDLRVWGTRLFEFQFADDGSDELRAEVDEIGPALRDHIDAEIARRRAAPDGKDDVLARCLALQAEGKPGYADVQIRTALMGMIVGGPPQPPMVVPQAMEQLLRRPEALAGAQQAARDGDDDAPRRLRVRGDALRSARAGDAAGRDRRRGDRRRHEARDAECPKGAKLMVGLSSAMMDYAPARRSLRLPTRTGCRTNISISAIALHQCFGMHINRAVLQLMLKPLLKRDNLRRAPGRAGRLRKQGPFAVALNVRYD